MTPLRPGRAEVRRDLLALGFGAAVLFFVSLGARDLWQPNEPTYGQAVVEMSKRGDWIVPTVNGREFAEKPVLYYWMALAAAGALGGVDEFVLRLPAAAAGVLGVLLTYLLVVPGAGRSRARLAAVLFGTTYGVYWNSRAVQMDIFVAVSTLAVVLAVVRVADHGAAPLPGFALAGLAAGLGFLAKGPVAWLGPALVLLPYLAATRRLGALRSSYAAVGVAVGLAVSMPWLAVLYIRGETGFLREMLLRQNVTRFLWAWDHRAPFWYYLEYFWIDMAPWAWFVPLAAALPGRDHEERRLDLLAWIWVAAILAFFSLSESKRSPYILPIAPAVAILASGLGDRLVDGALSKARRIAALVLLAAAGLVAAACGLAVLLRVVPHYPEVASQGEALGGLLIAGGTAILAAFASRARARAVAPAAFLALVLSLEILAAVSLFPAANRFKSARPFCEQVIARVSPEEPLASYRFWAWRASYAFYTHRAIPNLESAKDLASFLAAGRRSFVIVEEAEVTEARSVLGGREPLVRAEIGGTTAYLFSSR
ncbi:MAG: glycosyltransferase family 39 protein [Acidobacteriia bacterium]|nr:glycosyltransferase family 39 protein [Terriglobia bacterium]